MDKSIFIEKSVMPGEKSLAEALGKNYTAWKKIEAFVFELYPEATSGWSFPGEKYGWSFRIKDKKRVLVYLLPRERYFKVAMVFGEKAFKEIIKSEIDDRIKTELQTAKPYAEGRGIRLDIKNEKILTDIKHLIRIKLAN